MSVWLKENLYAKGVESGRRSSSRMPRDVSLTQRQTRNGNQTMESYRVVFWGQCARGYEVGKVASAFAKRFKIQNSRQVSQLFSGKVVTLKRGLTEDQADRYVSAIQLLGGVCRKESEQKNYFEESEFKTRNTVSFLEDDFDPSTLSLSPKDEFSTEV